jgi:hypothetical protein
MATKQQALRVAARHGFVLDETVSGPMGVAGGMATFDHPTHSFAGDCRSIHDVDISMDKVWANCIERMEREADLLTPCTDPDCEYHEEINQ